MKIAILGYGKEGKSAETYFQSKGDDITIYDHLTPEQFRELDLSQFDLILRSPSVPPHPEWSSITRYFYEHCPCTIIGVTGTKGKGTTSSIIVTLLQALGRKVWLVGNIGNPAIDILDQIQPDDIVVYEMSSFQLWDLEQSPHIAVVLGIEPDHLNVHANYQDYVAAKANITTHQTTTDYCIYNQNNPDARVIGAQSPGTKLPYPITDNREALDQMLNALTIPGQHNRDNAEAALLAVSAYYKTPLSEFLKQHQAQLQAALQNFHGLPHRLEFLRELNGVRYYDDNFCTNAASMSVALRAFPQAQIVLIAGGRDKTNNTDLPEISSLIQTYSAHVVLIGESGHDLAKFLPSEHYTIADDLASAVIAAQSIAEKLSQDASNDVIVLMSPAAASFDMFENVYDRGAKFQHLIQELT